MANPFPTKFNSNCNSCGESIPEGDFMYACDGQFVCEDCARENGNVCPECCEFKKQEYKTCYECKEDFDNSILLGK